MIATDIMSSDVKMVSPDTTVTEAAQRMRDEDVGILPVSESDKLVGMITDRDIVINCLAEGKNVKEARVRDIMSDEVLYVFDDQDAEEIAKNMASNKIRRLPVINRDKRLVGLVSLGDLAAAGASDSVSRALRSIASAP